MGSGMTGTMFGGSNLTRVAGGTGVSFSGIRLLSMGVSGPGIPSIGRASGLKVTLRREEAKLCSGNGLSGSGAPKRSSVMTLGLRTKVRGGRDVNQITLKLEIILRRRLPRELPGEHGIAH